MASNSATTSSPTNSGGSDDISAQIQIHRGAIDQTTITTQPPTKVMQKVHAMLLALGVNVQVESTFRYRCIRPRKERDGETETEADNAGPEAEEDEESRGVGDKPEAKAEAEAEDPQTPTQTHPHLPSLSSSPPSPPKSQCTLYGPTPSDDPADEVRFSIELTRLAGLSDTYSLDIRRLKGHLRSYKFIYDTLRDRAELNR